MACTEEKTAPFVVEITELEVEPKIFIYYELVH